MPSVFKVNDTEAKTNKTTTTEQHSSSNEKTANLKA